MLSFDLTYKIFHTPEQKTKYSHNVMNEIDIWMFII